MDYKTLYNSAIDYILFTTNTGAGYRDFLKVNQLKDNNTTQHAFINAYKYCKYLLSH